MENYYMLTEPQKLKAYINNKQNVVLTATGNSMRPTICTGDRITITSEIDNIIIGDIIVFFNLNSKRYIAHRIVAFLGNRLIITKGDNNSYCDQPIHKSEVIGKIINVERHRYEKILK